MKNTPSYKELYELIDERFDRLESQMNPKFDLIHDRISKVHSRIDPIEKTVDRIWIYATFAIGFVTILVQIGVGWIKEKLNI
jgi:hypothetical protein